MLKSFESAFKTSSKTVIQKAVEAIGDLIGNKNGDFVTRASKTSPKRMQKQMKKKYL